MSVALLIKLKFTAKKCLLNIPPVNYKKAFDATECIAVITQHIPGRSFQLVMYYGWYSNRSRGDRRKDAGLKTGIPGSVPTQEGTEVLDVWHIDRGVYLSTSHFLIFPCY